MVEGGRLKYVVVSCQFLQGHLSEVLSHWWPKGVDKFARVGELGGKCKVRGEKSCATVKLHSR